MIAKLSPESDVRAAWGVGGYWKAKGCPRGWDTVGVDRQEVNADPARFVKECCL